VAGDQPVVAAVVVTYNRRALLMEALAAVQAQTRPADTVIVVDNASTDESAAAVAQRFPAARLERLARNTGGAGGFAFGLAAALAGGAGARPADLIWLMDDDTIPEPGALGALLEARDRYPGAPPALIASRVVWTDGRPHPMNTPRVKPFARESELRAAAAARCQPIRSASFVSVLVDAAVTARRGLPQADYFLWNDDFEFTTRLLRGQAGLLCPASVVVHKTAAFGGTDNDPGPRFFYEVRNKIWTLRTGAALTPAERVMYGGSTLRRWARTFAKSGDRRALGAALARGAAAGVATRPRPTAEVLADVGLPGPPAAAGGADGRRAGRLLT
jgi:rhamnopyranosyl-N-acetylglucosaminyl-diphospho-decaprenol beta-1,3/1,4-galactofuranosyltransferase